MSELTFYANRTDGLGERLRSMLVAMTLAEKFDGRFLFYWDSSKKGNEYHATESREDIFAERFIADYCLRLKETEGIQLLKEFFKNGQETGTYRVPVAFPKEMPQETVSTQDVKRAFDRIEFSAPLTEAVSQAYTVQLPDNIVALHLRAGDIIYGGFRDLAQYIRKVVPFTLATRLIQRSLEDGKSVLVFGQDGDLIEQLTKQDGVLSAAEYMPEGLTTSAQMAMFDMVLMSRCQDIYAGSSGFALFAGLISGTEVIDPYSSWSAEDALQDILQALERPGMAVSREQIAFACKIAFLLNCRQCLGDPRWLNVIREGRRHDGSNLFFWVAELAVLYELERFGEAESVASAFIKSHEQKLPEYFARLIQKDRVMPVYNYRLFDPLVKAAGDYERAAQMIDILHATPDGPRLLKKIQRRHRTENA